MGAQKAHIIQGGGQDGWLPAGGDNQAYSQGTSEHKGVGGAGQGDSMVKARWDQHLL